MAMPLLLLLGGCGRLPSRDRKPPPPLLPSSAAWPLLLLLGFLTAILHEAEGTNIKGPDGKDSAQMSILLERQYPWHSTRLKHILT